MAPASSGLAALQAGRPWRYSAAPFQASSHVAAEHGQVVGHVGERVVDLVGDAGRQPAQAGQLLALHQGGLRFAQPAILLGQVLLQADDALPGPHPDAQLVHVERFGHEIVGPGLHAGHHVALLSPRCQQDHIDVAGPLVPANAVDQLGTINLGHHPVADDQRKALVLKQPPGFGPVLGGSDLVTPFLQVDLEQKPGHRFIFRDQDPHTLALFDRRRLGPVQAEDETPGKQRTARRHSPAASPKTSLMQFTRFLQS